MFAADSRSVPARRATAACSRCAAAACSGAHALDQGGQHRLRRMPGEQLMWRRDERPVLAGAADHCDRVGRLQVGEEKGLARLTDSALIGSFGNNMRMYVDSQETRPAFSSSCTANTTQPVDRPWQPGHEVGSSRLHGDRPCNLPPRRQGMHSLNAGRACSVGLKLVDAYAELRKVIHSIVPDLPGISRE
jgi:hypothetical protein